MRQRELVHDALMTVKDVVEYPYTVPGGGAPEAVLSQQIREWSNSLEGRAQLGTEQFADSIELFLRRYCRERRYGSN